MFMLFYVYDMMFLKHITDHTHNICTDLSTAMEHCDNLHASTTLEALLGAQRLAPGRPTSEDLGNSWELAIHS